MSKWRPHLCLKLFVCLYDMTLLKCVCVHVNACRLNSLCTICLTQQTNVDKRGRVTGDSFTTEIIMAAQFCSATYAWPWVYAAICLCWVIWVSHIPTSVFPPLFLIHHFSSMMSTAPDAMCWHPQINAKVNGKTKGVKWFARGCGLLLSRHSDTLGLHRKEIGSRGNESRLCDVIYYNTSVKRGGVSLITGSNEQLSCV